MSKYSPLRDYLLGLPHNEWSATFEDIERILGFELPASAHKYQAWWANELKPKTHVQKHQWMAAGFVTRDLNLKGKHITFVRK